MLQYQQETEGAVLSALKPLFEVAIIYYYLFIYLFTNAVTYHVIIYHVYCCCRCHHSLPLLLYLCDCEWCPLAAPIISYIKGHLKDADVFFSQRRAV